ncbi:MAG: RNA polymerase-binding protein DksA [Zetaproteobacteria bacterium]|nr:RNA polymerase-binding protein DksA [Zetaproteobacteria bacterium]
MALSKEELDAFEVQLNDWRKELMLGQNESLQALQGQEQATYPDPTDQASAEADRNFDLRIKDRERHLVRKIDQALNRIKAGEFGECEDCGGDIGQKRLQARPVTTLCIDCKMEQEQAEKTLLD